MDHDGIFELKVLFLKHLKRLDGAVVVMRGPDSALVVGGLHGSSLVRSMTIFVFVRLGVASNSRIQMLVVGILMGCSRRMGEACDVALRVGTAADPWVLHATVGVVGMQAVRIALVRRASLHFKQRIHLLLTLNN